MMRKPKKQRRLITIKKTKYMLLGFTGAQTDFIFPMDTGE
ncbi:MAG: hypothetical protein ETSY2_13955 [Candidatus Entotheonella gemina]|uniref:Uncharacterized protein n=1 Tax=Candidatus Entotheonella gemina TaxID=1429439 RepID=W4MAN5_9BACT|nr:MAG: hypothetical protein ETSY2_13955 [Candidatus Entotheonella gemina]